MFSTLSRSMLICLAPRDLYSPADLIGPQHEGGVKWEYVSHRLQGTSPLSATFLDGDDGERAHRRALLSIRARWLVGPRLR
jgi:hypothetical protein